MQSISDRELNRALLARQHLLEPTDKSSLEIIGDLLAIQAQEAEPPYTAIWARSKNFDRDEVTELFMDRTVVRASGFRMTIHLMTAEDYLAFYPIQQSSLTRGLNNYLELHPDPEEWLPVARQALRSKPSGYSGPEMRAILDESVPGYHPDTWMGVHVRMAMASVRIPRKGPESNGSRDYWVAAEEYLGRELPLEGDVRELVRRYLRGYGPASIRDAQNFLGMTRLREVFDELAPELLTFKTERGVTVFDLPESPRPREDTPAPVRLIAAYDHVILGHEDRRRIIPDHYRLPVSKVNAVFDPVFTVDGMVVGMWKPKLSEDGATIRLTLLEDVSDDAMVDVHAEASRYMSQRYPEADQTISVDRWEFS